MYKIKFQKPYVIKGDLMHFETNFESGEIEPLIKNGDWVCNNSVCLDEPIWIRNRQFHYIRTLKKDGGNSIIPLYAYVVSHNGTQFVIGSRENKEQPEFLSLIPDELFQMENM